MGIISRSLLLVLARVNTALDQAEDPRQMLEYAAERQREQLRALRLALIEVATVRHQLERQAERLNERLALLDSQARQAVEAGRDDLARRSLAGKQATLAHLAAIEHNLTEVAADEARLVEANQRAAERFDEADRQRQILVARYSAASAQAHAAEHLAGLTAEAADLSHAVERAGIETERLRARTAALDLLLVEDDIERELHQLASEQAVERELAALKSGVRSEEA